MSNYTEIDSATKAATNAAFASLARTVTEGKIIVLDAESLRSTSAAVQAGVPAARFDIPQLNAATLAKQQATVERTPKLADVKLAHADGFDILSSQHSLAYFDTMQADLTQAQLERLASWSNGKKGKHALMLTIALRSKRKQKLTRKLERITGALPHLKTASVYTYRASSKSMSMTTLTLTSWARGGRSTTYRPDKIVGRDGDHYIVQWAGYPSKRDRSREHVRSEAVRALLG